MTDFENILPLWRELEAAGSDYVLATVVDVEGPSYRKPGARMLIAPDGRRAGTVSGGCLEAEVAKRAWWLTESGPTVGRYSTAEEDGEMPYGSGCGGVVFLLLERRQTAQPLLRELEKAFHARTPLAIATVLEGGQIGRRMLASPTEPQGESPSPRDPLDRSLGNLALLSLDRMQGIDQRLDGSKVRVWVDYRAARPGLWIFGGGDDARPLLRLARSLGWFVAIADGRAHLATPTRFPEANQVLILAGSQMDVAGIMPTDAALLVTHSFEQDANIMAALLGRNRLPAYVGVLGPQRRTREVLAEAARRLGLDDSPERLEQWLEQLHAPTGLDLGAETPVAIALSIVAEIQQTLNNGSALPMRQVRAVRPEMTRT